MDEYGSVGSIEALPDDTVVSMWRLIGQAVTDGEVSGASQRDLDVARSQALMFGTEAMRRNLV